MNEKLKFIIENIWNSVQITVPDVDAKALYTVVGVTNLDTDLPIVVCKKDSNATFNIPYNLIGEVIIPTDTEKYCYVLDFSSTGIFRLNLINADKKPEDFANDEDLLQYWGFNPDSCQWMFTNEKLDIVEIDKPLK